MKKVQMCIWVVDGEEKDFIIAVMERLNKDGSNYTWSVKKTHTSEGLLLFVESDDNADFYYLGKAVEREKYLNLH